MTVVISTSNLTKLPRLCSLRRLLQSMAVLDAVLCPEWQYRYYSFNSRWNPGEQMGSMRNGQGDEFFAHFSAAGCYLKGFVHDSPAASTSLEVAAIERVVPKAFSSAIHEPAFRLDSTTFCVWQVAGESTWKSLSAWTGSDSRATDPDGSEYLLSPLQIDPLTYATWAAQYYEVSVDSGLVALVYGHAPLDETVVRRLNADASMDSLIEELAEIGYPATGPGPDEAAA